jgi:uncharacterized membrane protein
MKPFTNTAVVLLAIIGVAHLLRFFFHVSVVAGGYAVPDWPSLIIGVALGILAYLVWREHYLPVRP